MGRLVVVTGTGTEIGKTHAAEALLEALGRRGLRVAGLKPIESGVAPGVDTDAARLDRASTFHVKPFGYALTEPVSPHLAARSERTTIEPEVLLPAIEGVRLEADVALVELPGGLFSPLRPGYLNVDFARALRPDRALLFAPDRLGVLHDVIAVVRACPLRLDGLVLIAPATPDPSTGRNTPELAHFVDVPVLATLPRAPTSAIAELPSLQRLADLVVS
jgi:dethiobiotin synthetase